MSAHTIPHDMLSHAFRIPDPGAGGTIITEQKGRSICSIVTLTAEARSLPAPNSQYTYQEFLVYLDTDGGDCTITVTGGQGVSSITLNDAGDFVLLVSISIAGTSKWVVLVNSGATVS